MSKEQSGWTWLDDGEDEGNEKTKSSDRELVKCAARCFAGSDGQRVLTYLQTLTRNRSLGPDCTDAQLRHLEGQRHLVAHLYHLIEAGQQRL